MPGADCPCARAGHAARAGVDSVLHTCPVCGIRHAVHPIRHRLAYGRQLACSPRCRTLFPHLVRSRFLGVAAEADPTPSPQVELAA